MTERSWLSQRRRQFQLWPRGFRDSRPVDRQFALSCRWFAKPRRKAKPGPAWLRAPLAILRESVRRHQSTATHGLPAEKSPCRSAARCASVVPGGRPEVAELEFASTLAPVTA